MRGAATDGGRIERRRRRRWQRREGRREHSEGSARAHGLDCRKRPPTHEHSCRSVHDDNRHAQVWSTDRKPARAEQSAGLTVRAPGGGGAERRPACERDRSRSIDAAAAAAAAAGASPSPGSSMVRVRGGVTTTTERERASERDPSETSGQQLLPEPSWRNSRGSKLGKGGHLLRTLSAQRSIA